MVDILTNCTELFGKGFTFITECVYVLQSHPVAVRYALGGARILSGILATGQPSLVGVAEELGKSSDSTDRDVASSIRKAIADTSSHKDAVKTHGLACGKSCHTHTHAHTLSVFLHD